MATYIATFTYEANGFHESNIVVETKEGVRFNKVVRRSVERMINENFGYANVRIIGYEGKDGKYRQLKS